MARGVTKREPPDPISQQQLIEAKEVDSVLRDTVEGTRSHKKGPLASKVGKNWGMGVGWGLTLCRLTEEERETRI